MPRVFNELACNTCRIRKVKCKSAQRESLLVLTIREGDEAFPSCERCLKAGRYCDRSEGRRRFIDESVELTRAGGRPQDQSSDDNVCKGKQLLTIEDPREALRNPEIADSFHRYITDIAPWYDLSDASRSFEVDVPKISLDEPLLFGAIMALSAMYTSNTNAATARRRAEAYHEHCVKLLIALDERDELLERGIALAATCLLRSYEILDEETDPNRHLRGAYSLASYQSLPRSTPNHSLMDAGFWNYLREDITFSLFSQCTLKIDLEGIPFITEHTSDETYLNSISLILGQIINAAFSLEISHAKLSAIRNVLTLWQSNLPRYFEPYSEANRFSTSKALPSVWMLQDCHAAVAHYRIVSQIVLDNFCPNDTIIDPTTIHSSYPPGIYSKEEALHAKAAELCGIAFTNNHPQVLVNAFGPIAYCGRFLRVEESREELVRRLLASGKATGWPVHRVVHSLRSSWNAETGVENREL